MARDLLGPHSLDVENGILWIHCRLVLGCLTNQALFLGERNE
jgi:hypothetical protein